MFLKTEIIVAVAMALVTAGSMFASDNKNNDVLVIKGTVMGDDGKPQKDAEIRVKRLDGKGAEAVSITNSRGQYLVAGLSIGDYAITAYDPDGFARSRAVIKTAKKGWAKVDFDLALDKSRGEGVDRMWQGALTGHLTNPNSHGAPISTVQ